MKPDISPEQQTEHNRAAFESGMPPARSSTRMGHYESPPPGREQNRRRTEAQRKWRPNLPNAGKAEREDLDRLRQFCRDESLDIILREAASHYAEALEKCLPRQHRIRIGQQRVTLPGCYYSRKPLTPTRNARLFNAVTELLVAAMVEQDGLKSWLAQYFLGGIPAPVSNFKMDCLGLVRGADGHVTRLVRFMNTNGETSEGHEVGGTDVLPNKMYSTSGRFKTFARSKGNFIWYGRLRELLLLHWDVTEQVAYRDLRLVQGYGWHEIPTREDDEQEVSIPGQKGQHGLWIYEGYAKTTDGRVLPADKDGIIWFEGHGYALSRTGREREYIQHRPPTGAQRSIV